MDFAMTRCSFTLLPTLGLVAALLSPDAAAQLRFENLTQFATSDRAASPKISRDARFVAFLSRIDPLGTNPDTTNEIWLQNLSTGGLTQVTSVPGFNAAQQIQLDAEGGQILFQSNWDFDLGGFSSPSHLWRFDAATGLISRVPGLSDSVTVSAWRASSDGRFVVLISINDLTGANPDQSQELFRLEVATGMIEQISGDGGGLGVFTPGVDADGDVITWSDSRDYDGTNADGTLEGWIWRGATGEIRSLTQSPTPVGNNVSWTRVSDTGQFVALRRSNRSVYHLDTQTGQQRFAGNQGSPPSSTTTLVQEAEISPDGQTIYYERSDRLGLWCFSASTGTLIEIPGTRAQITVTEGILRSPVDVAAGGVVVYRSPQDLDPDLPGFGFGSFDLFLGLNPQPIGDGYCSPNPNSTGGQAFLSAVGFNLPALGEVTLTGSPLPPGSPAAVIFGDQPTDSPLGAGRLCVGGTFSVIPQVQQVSPSAVVELALDFQQFGASWLPGTTWYFQYLFRDAAQGGRTVNLSSAVSITFQP